MHFNPLSALAILLSTSTLATACKCVGPNGNNEPATRACCQSAGGPASSGDCPAGDISNNLSTFAFCCKNYSTRSDCRCPFGCLTMNAFGGCAAEDVVVERELGGEKHGQFGGMRIEVYRQGLKARDVEGEEMR